MKASIDKFKDFFSMVAIWHLLCHTTSSRTVLTEWSDIVSIQIKKVSDYSKSEQEGLLAPEYNFNQLSL